VLASPPRPTSASVVPARNRFERARERPTRPVRGCPFTFRSRTPVHRSPRWMAIPARALDDVD
jgi:hypothetical protein